MQSSIKFLSDITVYGKYAKYLPEEKRREIWEEIVLRSALMHSKKFPALKDEIYTNYADVINQDVLPSMRTLQFAGLALEINNARNFNCSYAPIDHIDIFSEAMFLLLSGCGFSYSVQNHHIDKLPEIKGPLKKRRTYLINDSIIGWADAIKTLINAYYYSKSDPDFDYRDIRQKGSMLITSGGKAPGPQPLKDCIHNIRKVLDNATVMRGFGCKLLSVEAHDIMCYIADAVLSGGIRRAACLVGFSFGDEDMLNCKSPEELEKNPQRQRSNNSVVLLKRKLNRESFDFIFDMIEKSKSGEPGIIISNDKEMLFNPCGEASLKPNSFCNLSTINMSNVTTQEEFNKRAKVASFIGTLRKTTTEKDALLGVSMTGMASDVVMSLDFEQAAKIVLEENARVAKLIGINKAARTTLLKPEGTTSTALGCSSGIHSWHDEFYYLRRIRMNKDEALFKYLHKKIPELFEDEKYKPKTISILTVPIKVPEGAISRKEPAINLLNRCVKINKEWIKTGHRSGANSHNVSCTVTVKEDEWAEVRNFVWNNRENINGMTFYRYDGNSYEQSPFESCSEQDYNKLINILNNAHIDLTKIKEEHDFTDHKAEAACAGGGCELKNI